MERTYKELPDHSIVYYSTKFAIGGLWNNGFILRVKMSDSYSYDFSVDPQYITANSNIRCKNTVDSYQTYFVGKVVHDASSITIRFEWGFNVASDDSTFFAVREVSLLFGNIQLNDYEEAYVTFGDSNVPSSTTCAAGYYNEPETSNCQTCSPLRPLCFSSSSSQCYKVPIGAEYNGSSVSSCTSPCYACGTDSMSSCQLCQEDYFLSSMGSCLSSCGISETPEIFDNFKICRPTCTNSQYLNYDFTCSSSCNPPLVKSNDNQGYQTCEYPCPQSENVFLYLDGTCSVSCPYYPMISNSNNYQFCYLCQSTEYTYQNGSCQSSCPAPFIKVQGERALLCQSPCEFGTDQFYYLNNQTCLSDCPVTAQTYINEVPVCDICKYIGYLYENDSCLTSCQSPFIPTVINSTNYCINSSKLLEDNSKKYLSGQARATNIALQVFGGIISTCAKIISVIQFTNPGSIFLAIFTDMLDYLKYLDINYPENLQEVLYSDHSLPINFISDIPPELQTKFPNSILPRNFQKFDLPSSFFVNFWNDAISLGLLVFGFILIVLTELSTRGCGTTLNSVCLKLRQSLKYNFLLAMFFALYGELVFFSSLEFRTNNFVGFGPIVSFTLCLLMNILGVFILAHILVVIKTRRKIGLRIVLHTQNQFLSDNDGKWKDYEILFEAYKEQSFIQQAYVPLSIMRFYMFFLIVSYLCSFPLVQTVLINVLNVSMLLLLIIKKPLKRNIELAQYIFKEIIFLIINLCVLVLAILDKNKAEAFGARNALGSTIVWVTTGFSSCVSLCLLFQLGISLKRNIKSILNRMKLKRSLNSQIVITAQDGSSIDGVNTSKPDMSSQAINLTSPDWTTQGLNVVSSYKEQQSIYTPGLTSFAGDPASLVEEQNEPTLSEQSVQMNNEKVQAERRRLGNYLARRRRMIEQLRDGKDTIEQI